MGLLQSQAAVLLSPLLRLLTLAGISALFTLSAFAHHSASEFDPQLPVSIEGTINKLEWKSPHARLYVDVKMENGETVTWNFELPSPNTLMRRGWKRNTLSPGEKVSVTGMRARNFPTIAIARSVLDKDDKPMFAGSADGDNQ